MMIIKGTNWKYETTIKSLQYDLNVIVNDLCSLLTSFFRQKKV